MHARTKASSAAQGRVQRSKKGKAPRQAGAMNKQGQRLGRKGTETRMRLMKAAERLLRTHSPVQLTAVAIAKAAGTSTATFYMYFDDIREILIALAASTIQDMQSVLAVLEEDWDPDAVEEHAARLAEAFYQFWDLHRPVLRYRNLEADRGDPAFDKLRAEGFYPFIEGLATRILELCSAQTRPSRGDARALASVLYAAMEYQAAVEPEAVYRTVGLKRMKASQARVIAQVISATRRGHMPLPKS